MFSLLPDVVVQFLDGQGKPLAGGLVYTYESGTTTLKPTFADPEGKTPNTNPIVLDAAGRAKIYLDTGAYRVRVLSRDEVLITDTNQVSRFVNNVELASVLQTVESGLAELEAVRESLEAMVDDVFREQKGYPNGIAPLGGDGKIESGYLPSTPNASTSEKGLVKLATSGSTSATDVVTAKMLDDFKKTMLGFGQTWKDVTESRAVNTSYTNTTDQPIEIAITAIYSTLSSFIAFLVNDEIIMTMREGDGERINISLIIPPNATYKLSAGEIRSWWELRK